MIEKQASGLSIRDSRLEDVEAVLELWKQAEELLMELSTRFLILAALAGAHLSGG